MLPWLHTYFDDIHSRTAGRLMCSGTRESVKGVNSFQAAAGETPPRTVRYAKPHTYSDPGKSLHGALRG